MKSFGQATSGLGLLVGVIVGAGMFAIPYAVARAGLFWGSIHLVVTFLILTCIHLLYGAVITATPGKHRLPGYAKIHVGVWAGRLAFLSAFGGFYGALLVYGILGGAFLSQLAPAFSLGPAQGTFLFFAVAAGILLFDLKRIGTVNFVLTAILIMFVGYLALVAFPYMRLPALPGADTIAARFLPYGVFLFAFAGASAVPDVADIFRRQNSKLFRRILVVSTVIPLIIYGVFLITVLGVSGAATSPEAIFGLESVLGRQAVAVGSVVGLLAVFTSFLALGLDLKNIFRYDVGWHTSISWFLVVSVPALLFFFGISDFVRVIGFVGAGAIGIDGIIILLASLRVRHGNSFHLILPLVLMAALAVGVAFEFATLSGLLKM